MGGGVPGTACSFSVPPVPKHVEKEKPMKPGQRMCEGLYGGITVCADLEKLLFPAGPNKGGLSWYREQRCRTSTLLRCSIACRVYCMSMCPPWK